MSQNTLKHSEIESELRKLAEIATSKPPSSKKKTTTHSSTVSPKFSSPVSKAAIQLEIAQVYTLSLAIAHDDKLCIVLYTIMSIVMCGARFDRVEWRMCGSSTN